MTSDASLLPDGSLDRSVRAALDALPQFAWTTDAAGRNEYVNRACIAYTGLPGQVLGGEAWLSIVHPDDRARAEHAWATAVLDGSPFEVEYRLRAADGSYRWFKAGANAFRDEHGVIARWFGTCADIDDLKRAQQSLRFLSDTGESLAATLDGRAAMTGLARACIGAIADACVIFAGPEKLDLVAAAHHDPVVAEELRAFYADLPVHARPPGSRAWRSGAGLLLEQIPLEPLRAMLSPEKFERAVAFGFESAIIAPLNARNRSLGVMYLLNHAGSRTFTTADLQLALEIARRAAITLVNAESYARERTIADTLQRAMLPEGLPTLPGLTLSAEYVAGGSDAHVGGDWYDAFELPDGRLLVSTGDVTGRGLDAAVTMGRLRESLGVLSLLETDPARLLNLVDRALRRTNPDAIVTALVGVVDRRPGTFTYASAGHPAPIVRSPDGSVTTLPARGLPLGLRGSNEPPSATITLPTGSAIVLYTDGLTEFTRDVEEGERRVAEAIADAGIALHPEAAAQIRRRVLGDRTRDDVAVLVVTLDGDLPAHNVWSMRWTFDASDARFAHDVRDLLVRFLRSRGTPDADYDGAGLIFGELIGNVVRHAPGRVDIELDWSGDRPVLIVDDFGPGFDPAHVPEAGFLAESGRGLFLIGALSERVDLVRRAQGGMRARVVLPVAVG